MGAAESGEGEIENEEGEDCDGGEDPGLQGDHLPEDVAVAERAEPLEVDPGGEDGGATEDETEENKGGKDEEAASPSGGFQLFRVDQVSHVPSVGSNVQDAPGWRWVNIEIVQADGRRLWNVAVG